MPGAWLRSLAMGDAAAALLRGMACRLLLDEQLLESADRGAQFNRNLSLGAPPMDVAAWLDGFLNRRRWCCCMTSHLGRRRCLAQRLGEVQFAQILPLVRRSFSAFSNHERQSLGDKVKRTPVRPSWRLHPQVPQARRTMTRAWDESRALLALPVLNELLGLNLPRR
jgi:hypothetical protein